MAGSLGVSEEVNELQTLCEQAIRESPLVCLLWLDDAGGTHFIGAGQEQPLSRLKLLGLLESVKLMVHQQILHEQKPGG